MMSYSPPAVSAAPPPQHSQPRKRRSDADETLRVRTASPSPFSGELHAPSAPLTSRNPLELRAFGLEDRADAVISSGSSTGWSLNNLSQWRQEMAQAAQPQPATADASVSHKAYVAQRQREFKQQLLRSARRPPPPASQ